VAYESIYDGPIFKLSATKTARAKSHQSDAKNKEILYVVEVVISYAICLSLVLPRTFPYHILYK
jgi:hypothetical protein